MTKARMVRSLTGVAIVAGLAMGGLVYTSCATRDGECAPPSAVTENTMPEDPPAAGTEKVQPATDEDVARLAEALKDDPFLEHADWFLGLANGRTKLTADALDTFLMASRYPVRRIDDTWRALDVPYQSTTAVVFVALSSNEEQLWFRLDLRALDAAVMGNADRLQPLLRQSSREGHGSFIITADDILSLCDHLDADGVTIAALERAIAELIEQAEKTADVWRG